MSKKKNGLRDVVLECDLSEATEVREEGVLKNVVILTGEKTTRNNTHYTKKALVEASTRYEGAKMFLDHGDDAVRSVRDYGGVYRNVTLQGNRVVGDLHLREGEDVRNLVFSMAKHKAGGLSIRDRGRGHEEDDVFMVEGFAKGATFSVDLVTEPSANINLHEHHDGDDDDDDENENKGGNDMDLSKVTLEQLEKENPTLLESIRVKERDTLTKEFEEKLKKGEDAEKILAHGKKLNALAEAGFPPAVHKAVRKMIESDGITYEVAEGIIKTQKEVIESVAAKPAGDPKVKNHGTDRDTIESDEDGDDDKEEISDDALRESLTA